MYIISGAEEMLYSYFIEEDYLTLAGRSSIDVDMSREMQRELCYASGYGYIMSVQIWLKMTLPCKFSPCPAMRALLMLSRDL